MQDTSREFLTNARPQDKYKFFLMATQLDQMEKDFVFIKDQLENMKASLEKKSKVLYLFLFLVLLPLSLHHTFIQSIAYRSILFYSNIILI